METCALRHFVVKFAGHRLAISAQRAAVAPSNEAWAFGLLHQPQYFGGFCCCGHEKAGFTLRATKLALFAQLHVRGTSRQYYVIFKQWIGVVPLHVLPFRRRRTVTSQSSSIGLTDCDP